MNTRFNTIYPEKLKSGDEIRVVASSRSLSLISEETRKIAIDNFNRMGLKVTFSEHCEETNQFVSSSVESRVSDLHEAFSDPNVKGIFTVIGGHNVNQILDTLDYTLIRKNPKVICGYSDITALCNAIYARTGLVTYSGPHFSTLGMKKGLEYTLEYFKKCLMGDQIFEVSASKAWSDDAWFMDQENRTFIENTGIKTYNPGDMEGTIVGGNLCTLNLLQGTPYMPDIENAVLFIEDDLLSFPENFDRDLQSLMHQIRFNKVQGIVFGRFQVESGMTEEKLLYILNGKKALKDIPIIYDVDFGHTTPHITFPIGGFCRITASESMGISIRIESH